MDILNSLPTEVKMLLKNSNVKTLEDAVNILSNELKNAVFKEDDNKESFVLLIKRLLQVIDISYDPKAKELAKEDREKINQYLKKEEVDEIRERWNNYIMEYDDSFLDRLDSYCSVEKSDLQKMVDGIIKCIKSRENYDFLGDIASVIIYAMTPSIATIIDDKIATIKEQIDKDPKLLTSDSMLEDLRLMAKTRIECDKNEIERQIAELESIIEQISLAQEEIKDFSSDSTKAIGDIKGELDEIDLNANSFSVIKNKLLSIANSFESETAKFSKKVDESVGDVNKLKERISELEDALNEEKKKSMIDELTKLPNRRSIDRYVSQTEALYKKNGDNYAFVLLDIDDFKNINDSYSHKVGDIVLSTMGKFLNKYKRKTDFVGRWGGEEFLIVLQKIDIKKATIYANKLRELIENSKFMHKNTRIKVTISVGVADRNSCKSVDELFLIADKKLIKAKKSGRNRVIS